MGNPRDPLIAVVLAYLPVFEVKALLVKTPPTSDKGLGRTELELTWRPPSSGLALIAPEGVMQAVKEEKQSMVLPNCKPTNHDNNQHGKISLVVPQWYFYLGGNSQLPNWT